MSEPVCPVCGTPCTAPPLHRYSVQQAAAHHCPEARDADRYQRLVTCVRRLWNGDSAAVHICPKCQFGFGWPHIGGDGEFYGILHEMAKYPQQRWEFGETIRAVIARSPSGRVVDIGAGDGAFLKQVPGGWERWAVESSPQMRAVLADIGVKAVESPQHAMADGTHFDLVTLFQTLEHISQFRDVLATCRDMLKPGGKLAISVPDARMIDQLERITGMSDMPPNHINRWSEPGLRLALEQQGFVVNRCLSEPPDWHNAPYYATLKVRAAAQNKPHSISAKSFGFKPPAVRTAALAGLSGLALLSMAHRLPKLRMGQSMLMISTRP